jgi:uncharacterized protein (TIGR01568 family)
VSLRREQKYVMKSPAAVPAKKRRSGSGGAGFGLGWGCKDAKSVSVSASSSPASSTRTSTTTHRRSGAGTTTDTQTSSSSFSVWEEAVAELRYKNNGDSGRLQESSAASTASFSGLLRELSELEKSVASLRPSKVHHNEEKLSPVPSPPLEQAKGDDDKGDLFRAGNKENQFALGVDGVGLQGSVAVVKQSGDPLGDFRRSMLQLIVENGIVAAEDLHKMLCRFLALNSPHHHDAIHRAFAEIWDDVFVATSLDRVATPGRASVSRGEPGRAPVPRTPPRHRRSPPAWRV